MTEVRSQRSWCLRLACAPVRCKKKVLMGFALLSKNAFNTSACVTGCPLRSRSGGESPRPTPGPGDAGQA
eukprot:8115975-Alexandrium_andersonii.AAC.1